MAATATLKVRFYACSNDGRRDLTQGWWVTGSRSQSLSRPLQYLRRRISSPNSGWIWFRSGTGQGVWDREAVEALGEGRPFRQGLVLAVAFGLLTLWSGGMVLFGPDAARVAAGQFVPLVLWFNFLSGPVYIAAGIGVFLGHRVGKKLAIILALALGGLFALFLAIIAAGQEWEMRTLGALIVRFGFWSLAAWASTARR